MSIYQLKFCKEEDKFLLINFIKKYWQADHAFVKSDDLLRFQHYNPEKKEFSFILGLNTQTNEVDGIIGLIPVSQYDPALVVYDDTWSGIWKVRSDVKNEEIGSLGIRLFNTLNKFASHGSIGMSRVATKMHAMMRYTSCVLNQYYILNPECIDFKIAVIPFAEHNSESSLKSNYSIKEILDINNINEDSVKQVYYPKKSLAYLKNRFIKHPIYAYKCFGFYDENLALKTIFVSRTINLNESKVTRIVDVYGPLDGLGSLKVQFEAFNSFTLLNIGICKVVVTTFLRLES
jgi:hypothetical protein